MKKILIELLQIVIIWGTLSLPSAADSLSNKIIREGDVVHFGSEVSEDSYKRLVLMYKKQPYSTITLSSKGGSYDAGMKIAHLVHSKNIKVYVPKYCASACTFIFFGAKVSQREMAHDAMLGLHNVSFEVDKETLKKSIKVSEAMEFAQQSAVKAGMMISFYSANGIPSDVLLKVSQIYGRSVVNIQRDDLIRWGSIQKKVR